MDDFTNENLELEFDILLNSIPNNSVEEYLEIKKKFGFNENIYIEIEELINKLDFLENIVWKIKENWQNFKKKIEIKFTEIENMKLKIIDLNNEANINSNIMNDLKNNLNHEQEKFRNLTSLIEEKENEINNLLETSIKDNNVKLNEKEKITKIILKNDVTPIKNLQNQYNNEYFTLIRSLNKEIRELKSLNEDYKKEIKLISEENILLKSEYLKISTLKDRILYKYSLLEKEFELENEDIIKLQTKIDYLTSLLKFNNYFFIYRNEKDKKKKKKKAKSLDFEIFIKNNGKKRNTEQINFKKNTYENLKDQLKSPNFFEDPFFHFNQSSEKRISLNSIISFKNDNKYNTPGSFHIEDKEIKSDTTLTCSSAKLNPNAKSVITENSEINDVLNINNSQLFEENKMRTNNYFFLYLFPNFNFIYFYYFFFFFFFQKRFIKNNSFVKFKKKSLQNFI